MRGKYKASFMMVIMIMASVGILAGSWEATGNDTRAGEGENPYCTFYTGDLGSHVIGDTVTFRIRVYNTYDGNRWTESTGHYTDDYLYYCKLTVEDQAHDMDDNPVDVIHPTEVGSMDAYNGPNNQGYNLSYSSSRYYYSEEIPYVSFSMKIDGTQLKAGDYRLNLQLSFKVRTAYNTEAPDGFSYSMVIVQRGYVQFHILSNVYGASEAGVPLKPYEGYDQVPLYSGSKYMTVSMTNTRSYTGRTLDNFMAILSLPSDEFTVYNSDIILDDLSTSYRDLKWKVDVEFDAVPMVYEGFLRFNYDYDEENYQEGPYPVYLKVEATPLVVPPDTGDMTDPTVTIQQKTDKVGFSVDFTNGGNVRLSMVTVMLDLDSASYLKQSDFYYDENDNADKVYPPVEFTYENLNPSESFTATFPEISVSEMLPPGDYLVPIDYHAVYSDPSEGSSGITYDSYQMDEIYREDYMNIMWYRSDPRPTNMKAPHIMMRVMDDVLGEDLEISCSDTLIAGDSNVPLEFEIENRELYDLSRVTIKATSEKPDLLSSRATAEADVLLDEMGEFIPQGNLNYPGTKTLTIDVDVDSKAPSGEVNVTFDIQGYNNQNSLVTLTRTVPVMIMGAPAEISVVSVFTSNIRSGKEFDLSLTIVNTGGLGIDNYTMMLASNTNLVSITNPVVEGMNLEPGETRVLDFTCLASNKMDDGISVPLAMRCSYQDEEGNFIGFDDSEEHILNISTGVKDTSDDGNSDLTTISVMFLLAVILGAFILALAIVLSMLLFVKREMITGGGDKKVEDKVEEEEEAQPEAPEPVVQDAPQPPAPQPTPQTGMNLPPATTPQPAPVQQQPPAPQPAPVQQPPAQEPSGPSSGIDDLFD